MTARRETNYPHTALGSYGACGLTRTRCVAQRKARCLLTSGYLEAIHLVDAEQWGIAGHLLAEPESCLRCAEDEPTAAKVRT